LYRFKESESEVMKDREIEDNLPEEGEMVKPTTDEMTSMANW
jgi:hypothetical protein